ncbi:globin [Oesophagostomum dentatum]|uniref:Globin n=1 Tax=Oesophagostomum dentatum TaxID=61180 RepID=A0A0B1TRP7_OESDE|nr:globin [Oesophagostomum dentatum]
MRALKDLSREEKELLRASAKSLEGNIADIGCRILEMIFEQTPCIKKLFHFSTADDEAYRRSEMRQLAQKYMQALLTVVEDVEDPSALGSITTKLATVHCEIDSYWGAFIECTIYHIRHHLEKDESFADVCKLDAVTVLWRTVMRDVTRKMRATFIKEINIIDAMSQQESELPVKCPKIQNMHQSGYKVQAAPPQR